VCTNWVPQSFTVENKTDRKAISSKLLAHFEAEGGNLLQTVTVDEM
jgi:hypothetical protein